MEEKRQFKGVWIPGEVWLDNNLTLIEKCILTEIDSLEDSEKGCFASNNHFATFFNVSQSRISQILNILKDKQYIRIHYEYKGKEIVARHIYINRPPFPTGIKNIKGGIKNIKGGYLENCEDNNTSNNNTNNIDIYISEIQKFKPILSSTDYALIKEFIIDRYTIEQVKEAIAICENNNAYSIKYLIQVLVNPRKEKYKVALKNGINPKWLNEDLQADCLSGEELEELENEFKEFRK